MYAYHVSFSREGSSGSKYNNGTITLPRVHDVLFPHESSRMPLSTRLGAMPSWRVSTPAPPRYPASFTTRLNAVSLDAGTARCNDSRSTQTQLNQVQYLE